MINQNVFLKKNEGDFLALATISLLDRIKQVSKNQDYNFNPGARKDIKEMLEAGESLRIKLAKLGFKMHDLAPYKEGDEDEFLTKES